MADLRAAIDSGDPTVYEEDQFEEDYENEIVCDGLASTGVDYTAPPPVLIPSPYATQEQVVDDEDAEEQFDDRELELQGSMYSTLTAKTRRVKELKRAELDLNMEREHAKPFELLKKKHDEIEEMSDGDDKTASIHIFNTIGVLFNQSRHAPQLRDFIATLFEKAEAYYTFKEKKKSIKHDIAVMEKLRDEAELEDFMAKQKKRSQQEREDLDPSSKKARMCKCPS